MVLVVIVIIFAVRANAVIAFDILNFVWGVVNRPAFVTLDKCLLHSVIRYRRACIGYTSPFYRLIDTLRGRRQRHNAYCRIRHNVGGRYVLFA